MPKKDEMFLQTAIDAIDDKFGMDVVAMDIRALSVLTDYIVVATGGSPNQIKAIADEVCHRLHKAGLPQRHIEGYGGASWVLIDFGDMIVHIFDKESRDFYSIERVWGDAPLLDMTPTKKEGLTPHGR